MGWPGSVHNNRVWVNNDIYLDTDKYFDQKEYLLGDSAFLASAVIIPAFKKGHNSNRARKGDSLTTNLQRSGSRAKIVLGYSRRGFNGFEDFEG